MPVPKSPLHDKRLFLLIHKKLYGAYSRKAFTYSCNIKTPIIIRNVFSNEK